MGQPQEAEHPRTRIKKLLGWFAEHVAGTLIGLLVTALVAAGGAWLFAKGEVGDQLEDLRSSLADQGFTVNDYRKVALHPGAESHLFILSPEPDPDQPAKPDQLRVYDEIEGSLELKLALDPTQVAQAKDRVGGAGLATGFEIVDVTDLTGDGQDELVGAYVGGVGIELKVPVVIAWNPARGEYETAALLRRSVFEPPYPPLPIDAGIQADYDSPFIVRDTGSERLRAWAARSFVIERNPYGRGSVLAASVPGPVFPDVQIGFWTLGQDLMNKEPSSWCYQGPDGAARFVSRRPASLNPQALLSATLRELVRLDMRSRLDTSSGVGAVPPGRSLYLGVIVGEDCLVGE